MKDTELKPCPFCGGEVKIFTAPIKGTRCLYAINAVLMYAFSELNINQRQQ